MVEDQSGDARGCSPVQDSILIDWPTSGGRVVQASRTLNITEMGEQVERALNAALDTIRAMAHRVTKAVDDMEQTARPDEVELEFGINLDAEVGALVAKSSAGAQLVIKLKWESQADEPVQVHIA